MNIEGMFSTIAPTYDKLNRWLSFSRDHRWRQRAIQAVTAQRDLRVLDLCAGTLDMTLTLLQRFPHAQATAVDFSQAMLDHGRTKIPFRLQPQVELRREDALRLSLPAARYHAVLCAFGMRNLPDQVRALREIRRVLIPGGELVILEFFQPTTRAARLFAQTYGRYCIPLLGGLVSKHRAAYEYLRDSTAAFYPVPAYRALLQQEGFTVRNTRALSGGIAYIIDAQLTP